MAGAKAALQRQDSLANNLANVSTNGFRAEMQAFRAVPVLGDGASTRAYALETTIGHDTRTGPIQTTGRALDVALLGQAWLAVQGPDGEEAYTRAGALHIDAQGQLVTAAGQAVLGDGGPVVVPPGSAVAIADDGSLSVVLDGTPGSRAQTVARLKLVVPEQALTRGEDGLFRAQQGALEAEPSARLQSAALEGSNVSPVETMVSMIAAARLFEQQMKLLQDAQQREQGASKLLGSG
jgi:flagellar basal-body rod protein FlgF